MNMTITQKILSSAAGLDFVKPGDLIMAKIDMVLGNDITTPLAIREFDKIGCATVFDREKIAIVPDHFCPNKDIKSAEQAKLIREFSKNHGITNYFEIGQMGIEHALLPEKGLVTAGDVVIGADSHTCTYGALGAFSTGIGSTDMAAAMATGELWFKVPAAIKVKLTGKLQKHVSGKDVILHLIGLIGVDGARYMSLEFCGDGVGNLSIDDRFTIANMAIETGAKNGIFPVDDIAMEYIAAHSDKPYTVFEADENANYEREITIKLDELDYTVACPHSPSNTKSASQLKGTKIDQVVIGSCTNGRLGDLKAAAEVLRGRKIHPDVRAIIFPATQKIYLDAINAGYIQTFIEAGAAVSTPTCGPCLGGHLGILASGEVCVATTNRNFVGRMGDAQSEIYLASPAVAAASAVAGEITEPE